MDILSFQKGWRYMKADGVKELRAVIYLSIYNFNEQEGDKRSTSHKKKSHTRGMTPGRGI
jgi:hypothetical protein